MRGKPRILVIGPAGLVECTRQALPGRDVTAAPHALAGVWQSGQAAFDDVILSLSLGPAALSALRSIRQVAPAARLLVTCAPADEPRARLLLGQGVDDYLVEPLLPHDLQRAIQSPRRRPAPAPPEASPTVADVVALSEVLRNLSDGPRATLERLARLVQHTFDAQGAAITVDELSATAGDVSDGVIDEPILRGQERIGVIRLGRRLQGNYSSAAAVRLAELGRLIEVTVREAHERDRLRTLAWTDDLTGAHNRRYFDQALARLLHTAAERQSRVTLILFDIDDFKHYNDTYGHEVGDALLREVAVLLRHCSRADDVVARYGGDEFAVLLWDAEEPRVPGSRHPRDAAALAERFQRDIRAHEFACLGADAPGPVTLSGGLACFPWHGTTPTQLVRAADAALLEAKRGGKNRILLAGAAFDATPVE
jgi:diguanylate cyclase (GGDEF)-like protein